MCLVSNSQSSLEGWSTDTAPSSSDWPPDSFFTVILSTVEEWSFCCCCCIALGYKINLNWHLIFITDTVLEKNVQKQSCQVRLKLNRSAVYITGVYGSINISKDICITQRDLVNIYPHHWTKIPQTHCQTKYTAELKSTRTKLQSLNALAVLTDHLSVWAVVGGEKSGVWVSVHVCGVHLCSSPFFSIHLVLAQGACMSNSCPSWVKKNELNVYFNSVSPTDAPAGGCWLMSDQWFQYRLIRHQCSLPRLVCRTGRWTKSLNLKLWV